MRLTTGLLEFPALSVPLRPLKAFVSIVLELWKKESQMRKQLLPLGTLLQTHLVLGSLSPDKISLLRPADSHFWKCISRLYREVIVMFLISFPFQSRPFYSRIRSFASLTMTFCTEQPLHPTLCPNAFLEQNATLACPAGMIEPWLSLLRS